MRSFRSPLAVLILFVVVAGTLASSTAAFTDSTATPGNSVAIGTVPAVGIETTVPQESPYALHVSWVTAPDVGSTLSPRYTLQRSATADGAAPVTVYSGPDTDTVDLGRIPAEAPSVPFAAVAAGTVSTVALARDGSVYTWGGNDQGQLGVDFTRGETTPLKLPAYYFDRRKITAISSSERHVVVLSEDGIVYGWGGNGLGQLGNGSTGFVYAPVRVAPERFDGRRVVAIATGPYHTVALTEDGVVYTWGYNRYGQLGDGSTSGTSVPVQVDPASFDGRRVVSIAAGFNHTVAATEDGTVYAWGDDTQGQLGNGSASGSLVPMRVDSGLFGGRSVTAVSAGDFHTLAQTADGALFTWGYNRFGQLGDGSRSDSPLPARIEPEAFAGHKIVAITAGGGVSAAVAEDGSAYEWGYNRFGQLGNGSTGDSVVPSLLDRAGWGGQNITAIATGGFHTAAVTQTGAAYAWGSNDRGQLGVGTRYDSVVALRVIATEEAACRPEQTYIDGDLCSLGAGETYYYRVGYTLGKWDAPASAWTPLTTPGTSARADPGVGSQVLTK